MTISALYNAKLYLLIILSTYPYLINSENSVQCGGTLTESRGILQTPGFPNEFQVPISCKWVIDATEISSPNTSIVVYLTQLFVSEGLTFEEYETYDKRYNILGKHLHTVLENNVSKMKYIQTNQNVLVVTFELNTIENTHLRILDYFLDVYGFNLTYEITTEPVRQDSCIMGDCGFTGTCYYDYSDFFCRCFMGYSGPHCSHGPNSLCSADGTSFCQNGGICRLVGTTFASCSCAGGYTGERCETAIDYSAKRLCIINDMDRSCNNCSSGNSDGAELTTKFRLMQGPNFKKENLLQILKNQMTLFKITLEEIKVADLNYYEWGTEAVVHFYGLKKDKKRLETLINRWKHAGSIGSLTLLDKSTNDSRLLIKSITLNQSGLIREGDQFILSCVAQGTPRIAFNWFKDGILINVTKFTLNKWVRVIQDSHVKNQYSAVLGVEKVSYLDAGNFMCEAVDLGGKQCLSKQVNVRRPPSVKIEPMTLTVQKGENFTIKCICISNKNSQKFTYSWTKNRELLPIKTDMEKYEILFPGGSILQVSKIERPTMYSCLVQDEVTSTEVSIQVDVVDRILVHTCRGEKHLNILWPETAPGTQSVQDCPKGFNGIVTRWCILHDSERSVWQLPDFSFCTANSLVKSDIDFQRLQLGYKDHIELEFLSRYETYLKYETQGLLPGEGARILTLTSQIVTHINETRSFDNFTNITNTVFSIVGNVLRYNNSLMNQMQIILLQQIISNQIVMSKQILGKLQTYHKSYDLLDVTIVKLSKYGLEIKVPIENHKYPAWFPYKLDLLISNPEKTDDLILSCVVYKNLEQFLPTRSAIRLHDGTEIQYEIISKIVAVWLLNEDANAESEKYSFVMEFSHSVINTTINQWNVNCSSANYANYGYMWNVNSCATEVINSTRTKCVCSRPGSYAVFVTTVPVTIAKAENNDYQILVLIGCCVCLLFSTLSTIILSMHWLVKKSSITFLKIQYCFSIASAMIIFVVALSKDLNYEFYTYINTSLEIFLLVALASHTSKCLIVFTEFVQLSKAPNMNKTIVAISTGVPILTVFASHLTHKTIGKRQSSWWLINGSVSFNIFIAASLVMIFLYNVMYLMVIERLTDAANDDSKSSALAAKRKGLLKRSFSIFWSTVMMIFSSVMYINMEESQIWNYTFAISSIVLAVVFFTSYTCKPETPIAQDLIEKITLNSTAKSSPGTLPRSPLASIPESDFEKQSTLSRKSSEQHLQNSKSSVQLSDLQNIPNCAQNYSPEPYSGETSYKDPPGSTNRQIGKFKSFKECLRSHEEPTSTYSCKQPDLQTYLYSPDVVATRVHVELDLVTPIVHDPNCDHKNLNPDEPPIILCNIAVNSRCQVNSKSFPLHASLPDEKSVTENFENVQKTQSMCEKLQAKQAETSEASATEEKGEASTVEKTKSSDSLDGMLDKISHDLDYLLNRRKSTSSVGKSEVDSSSQVNQDDFDSHAF